LKSKLSAVMIVSSVLGLSLVTVLLASAVAGSPISVNISVYGTFLRAEPFTEGNPPGGSPVENPAIVSLDDYGYSEGDLIKIGYDGELYKEAFWDPDDPGEAKEIDEVEIIGVFSTTDELLPIDELNRVPGAIDSGEDYVTNDTHFQQWPTDIPEDFRVEPYTGMIVEIPEDAGYLFLCIRDSFYPDNLGGIRVTITEEPEDEDGRGFPLLEITVAVMAVAIILTLFVGLSRRKRAGEE